MRACVLFPGQGFQKFGMLAKLAAKYPNLVNPILQQCDKVLPQLQMSRLLLGTGDHIDVTPTEIAQPLLLAHSVAHYRVWEQTVNNGGAYNVAFGMGHSLGEYTAFVSAGLLSFDEALKLVRLRGEAMQAASSQSNVHTGMSVVVKPKSISSEEWLPILVQCSKSCGADIGAFNSPTLAVISGSEQSIKETTELLKQNERVAAARARVLVKKLPVSGAFHSRYMEPASQALKSLVSSACWQPLESAKFSIVSNVSGRPYESIDEIKASCVSALTQPVKWLHSVEFVDQQNVDEFISIGGDVNKFMENNVKAKSSLFAE